MSVFRKQTSRKGSVVYQQVLQKNFQIIQTFLKKFHQIFTKQDQFEQHLNKFAERFTEYDEILDQFRQQQRINIVMLQKKVNNMKSSVRQSHRASHRFSKINLPIFQAPGQFAEGGKNFTLLKFDSIVSNSNQASEEQEIQYRERKNSQLQKQHQQSLLLSTKHYQQLQQSINSMNTEITEMKDKITFLSAYTSSMANQQSSRGKQIEKIKKQLLDTVDHDAKDRIESKINKQLIQMEKMFLQQISNLAHKFEKQMTQDIQNKFKIIDGDLNKFEQVMLTKDQGKKVKSDFDSDMKKLASECQLIFSNKDQTKRLLNLLDKKFKLLESQIKDGFVRTENENDQIQYFQSLIQINSSNGNKSTGNSSNFLQKAHKSKSQLIKNHQHNNSSAQIVEADEDQKQNAPIQRSHRNSYKNSQQLSKGALLTSQVSKQFMKNFGLKQRKKLVKGNCFNRTSNAEGSDAVNSKPSYKKTEINIVRPVTVMQYDHSEDYS